MSNSQFLRVVAAGRITQSTAAIVSPAAGDHIPFATTATGVGDTLLTFDEAIDETHRVMIITARGTNDIHHRVGTETNTTLQVLGRTTPGTGGAPAAGDCDFDFVLFATR